MLRIVNLAYYFPLLSHNDDPSYKNMNSFHRASSLPCIASVKTWPGKKAEHLPNPFTPEIIHCRAHWENRAYHSTQESPENTEPTRESLDNSESLPDFPKYDVLPCNGMTIYDAHESIEVCSNGSISMEEIMDNNSINKRWRGPLILSNSFDICFDQKERLPNVVFAYSSSFVDDSSGTSDWDGSSLSDDSSVSLSTNNTRSSCSHRVRWSTRWQDFLEHEKRLSPRRARAKTSSRPPRRPVRQISAM